MPFVKLDVKTLESTLWLDPDSTRIFITALLLAEPYELITPMAQIKVAELDETGFIVPAGWYGLAAASSPGIAHRALMDIDRATKALISLGEPDKSSRSKEFDGRRLVRIDGGFIVLNFIDYRDKDMSTADRSKRWRQRQKEKASRSDTRDATRVTDATRVIRHQAEAEAEALKSKPSTSGILPDPVDKSKIIKGPPDSDDDLLFGSTPQPPPLAPPPPVVFGAAIQSPNGKKWGTTEDLETAFWMYGLVKARVPSTKPFDTVMACNWADHLRLTRTRDERPDAEMRRVFEWANKDSFWSANVLSPEALRRHWDKITAKMTAPTPGDLPRLAQWWQTEQGTKTKAQELGVPLRPGEGWSEFRERISAEIEHVKNVKIQEGARAKAAARTG